MKYMTNFLYNYGSYFSIAICLALIIWSYAERNFYSNYIDGNVYLIWSVYILPWVIIAANILWQWKR